MLYASTEEQLEECFANLINDNRVQNYPNYIKHVSTYIDRMIEWALCYRCNLPVRGNNTNNLCESAMMVIKE